MVPIALPAFGAWCKTTRSTSMNSPPRMNKQTPIARKKARHIPTVLFELVKSIGHEIVFSHKRYVLSRHESALPLSTSRLQQLQYAASRLPHLMPIEAIMTDASTLDQSTRFQELQQSPHFFRRLRPQPTTQTVKRALSTDSTNLASWLNKSGKL